MYFCTVAYSASTSQWVTLKSDSKTEVKEIIKSEVDKRDGYSSSQEETFNFRVATDEQARDDAAYKNGLAAAKAEFVKSKNRRDDLTAQFQAKSTELEDVQKEIKNHKASMDNYDNQIIRFEQDIKAQQESFKKWLKTEKQGEALVAVIYTRGFKDKKHDLDGLADKVSAPLMADQMGTYIRSYTTVVNNVLKEDFIQAVNEGTAKWNGEEPFLLELGKGTSGTAYLRLKRYELYPFQDSKNSKKLTSNGVERMKVAIIGSMYDLETLLSQNAYSTANLDLSRVQSLLAETSQSKKLAEEGLTDQVNSYKEKIATLQEKIANARSDKESQATALTKKDAQLEKLKVGLEILRVKKEGTEKGFITAQTTLQEKNRVRETIIIKTVLTTPKGSQTPAESASESIIDKLEEVKNDARTQHSSTTTTVVNAQLVDEISSQAVTEAKITGVKLISFINEGDSVKVKMAFRVRMELSDINQKTTGIKSVLEKPLNVSESSTLSGKKDTFRFSELTVLDTRTGLEWTTDGNIARDTMTWNDTNNWIKKLNNGYNYGGYKDWRLPTKEELESFAEHGFSWFNSNGFNIVKNGTYWTSSTGFFWTNEAWGVNISEYSISVRKADKRFGYYVWLVREGR